MSDLGELRTGLRRLVGDSYNDAAAWDDRLLDAGLRGGLALYSRHGPIEETSLIIDAAGYEVEIGDLLDRHVFDVLAVAYPWEDGASLKARMIDFRMKNVHALRSDSIQFQAGERLRLRYRPRHEIDGLDDGDETTIRDSERDTFLLAAAVTLLQTRARQLDARPSVPKGEADALRAMAKDWEQRFHELISGCSGLVSWGDVGL